MQRAPLIVLVLVTGALARAGCGAPPDASADPAAGEYRDRLNRQLDDDIAALSARIEQAPNDVGLYSQRGDKYFVRGKFAEAVRDFDKMVELRPALETSHWRRGIACFYAERYNDAARQFEVYHSFDNVDRENGIWRYLSQAKALGKAQAREGLLKYEKDDREPFPDVYRLFAGDLTGEQVLARIRDSQLPEAERDRRLFYAELYAGLNEFVEGRLEPAEKHLREAVRNPWGQKAGGGPEWMWHVARVHGDLLRASRAK